MLLTGVLPAQEHANANNDDVGKLLAQVQSKTADLDTRLGAILLLETLVLTVDPVSRIATIKVLIGVVQDDNEGFAIRHDATWLLVRIEAEAKLRREIAEALVTLVEDPGHDAALRKEIAEALGRMKSEAEMIEPRLVRLLEDRTQRTMVRAAAAGTLGEMGTRVADVPSRLRRLIDQGAGEEWPIRSSAILALSKVTPMPQETLRFLVDLLQKEGQPQTRLSAVQGVGVIAKRFQEDRATSALPDLERAASVLHAEGSAKNQVVPVEEAIAELKRIERGRVWNQVTDWVLAHKSLSAVATYYVVALSFSLLLLRARPLWLLRINQLLGPYTDVTLPAWLGGLKFQLRYLLLVGAFQYHDRVLDAWVATHVAGVRDDFERRPTVKDRNVHVMMPIDIDWPKRHRIAALTAVELQPTFARGRAVLLIYGEGGSGKTSLACQIAKWAMVEDKASRLCPSHYMLPVLIEYELDASSTASPPSLTDVIRGQLAAMTAKEEPPSRELLVHLLIRRRLLVIVDRFSELSTATRRLIIPSDPEFPVNALLITSRTEEALDGVPKTTIAPIRIEGNRLSTFMESYLVQCSKRDLFLDSEYFDACSRLSAIVGRRNITVLLAKLYAEQMIASKDSSSVTELPSNIPDLMLSYMNELNRTRPLGAPDDRVVQLSAKVLAWECLRDEYRPTASKRDRILSALLAHGDPEGILKYLEERLKVIRTVGAGRDQIGFTLDPLAEYLAALHLMEDCGEREPAWSQFLAKAHRLESSPATISGFLLAVLDCCTCKGREVGVPQSVRTELEAICATDRLRLVA